MARDCRDNFILEMQKLRGPERRNLLKVIQLTNVRITHIISAISAFLLKAYWEVYSRVLGCNCG
jgi:hypothetical protein